MKVRRRCPRCGSSCSSCSRLLKPRQKGGLHVAARIRNAASLLTRVRADDAHRPAGLSLRAARRRALARRRGFGRRSVSPAGRGPRARVGWVLKSGLPTRGAIAGGETGMGKSGVRFSLGHGQRQRLRPLLPRPDRSGPSASEGPENPPKRPGIRDGPARLFSKAPALPLRSLYTRVSY